MSKKNLNIRGFNKTSSELIKRSIFLPLRPNLRLELWTIGFSVLSCYFPRTGLFSVNFSSDWCVCYTKVTWNKKGLLCAKLGPRLLWSRRNDVKLFPNTTMPLCHALLPMFFGPSHTYRQQLSAAQCCAQLLLLRRKRCLTADAASSEQVRPLALNDTECHRNTH